MNGELNRWEVEIIDLRNALTAILRISEAIYPMRAQVLASAIYLIREVAVEAMVSDKQADEFEPAVNGLGEADGDVQ